MHLLSNGLPRASAALRYDSEDLWRRKRLQEVLGGMWGSFAMRAEIHEVRGYGCRNVNTNVNRIQEDSRINGLRKGQGFLRTTPEKRARSSIRERTPRGRNTALGCRDAEAKPGECGLSFVLLGAIGTHAARAGRFREGVGRPTGFARPRAALDADERGISRKCRRAGRAPSACDLHCPQAEAGKKFPRSPFGGEL